MQMQPRRSLNRVNVPRGVLRTVVNCVSSIFSTFTRVSRLPCIEKKEISGESGPVDAPRSQMIGLHKFLIWHLFFLPHN